MSSIQTVAEATERLRTPGASENWSGFGTERICAVDLRGVAPPGPGLLASLATLPAPTIALVDPGEEPPEARAFDLWVGSGEALAAVEHAVDHAPQASRALVQLLRLSEGLPPERGLLAESFTYSMLQAGAEFQSWLDTRRRREPALDPSPPLRIEPEADLLRLVLDRPSKHNAYGASMRDALVEALELALLDPGRRVRLEGAGPSFCSGGDLDEFGTTPDPVTSHAIRTTRHPAHALLALGDRVEVHVHGACIGAGIELPAFAPRIVAREDAFFQLPEVGMGLVPGAGGTVSLPRRIGRQRTAWMALTGSRVDAPTAAAWGLVDELA